MNRIVLVLLVGFLATSLRAEDDAKTIVAKAIKAKGGDGKKMAVTWKGSGTFFGMGEGVPYEGTWSVHPPKKFRMEINGIFTIVLNGDMGWVNTGGTVAEMNKEQVAEQQEAMHANWVMEVYPLTGKEYTLTVIPGDADTVGVKVAYKGRRDVELFFNKKTYLLAKVKQTVKDDQSGKEVQQVSEVTEYTKVTGVQVPAKMVIQRDGKKFVDGVMKEYTFADSLPEKTFAKPE